MPMGPMKSVRFIGAVTAVGYPARDANGPHEISTLPAVDHGVSATSL